MQKKTKKKTLSQFWAYGFRPVNCTTRQTLAELLSVGACVIRLRRLVVI